VGPLELLNLAALLVVLHRGEPIHVGYSGKSQGKVVPQWTQTGKQPVQTWSNFNGDGQSHIYCCFLCTAQDREMQLQKSQQNV